MLVSEVADSATTDAEHQVGLDATWHVPACVAAALKDVRLLPEHTEPPVQHTGEFWHWKLTPYGLDLMRTLTRASAGGFAYQETFLEPEQSAIPQLVLLDRLNSAIHMQLADPNSETDWAALLEDQPFLRERGIEIDPTLLANEIERLTQRILQNAYAETGSRHYHHPHLTKPLVDSH